MTTRVSVFLATTSLLVGLVHLQGHAGQAAQAPAQAPAATAAPAAATPGATSTTPRPVDPADVLAWKSIGPAALSTDGKWLAYRFTPVEGDSEVIIRAAEGTKEYKFTVGEVPAPAGPPAAGGGSSVAFSDDGKWAAFTVYPARKEAAKLRKAKKPLQNAVRLVNLSTGEDVEYPKVRQFAFSGDSAVALALHRYGPEGAGKDKPKGADLIVRELSSGNELTIGGVSEFAFDKAGQRLAWTIDAEEKIGNGVSVRELTSGIVTPLDSSRAIYEKPTWSEKGDALAVLKGVEDKAYEEKLYAVIGFSGFGAAGTGAADGAAKTTRVAYEPAKDTAFPAGMTISANRAPEWTEDRAALLFGITEAKKKSKADAAAADKDDKAKDASKTEPKPDAPKPDAPKPDAPKPADTPKADDADGEEKADLVVWHWQDPRLQSQQQVQEDRDKRFSFLATYRIADKKFIRLADDALRDVTAGKKGAWAMGVDRRAYMLSGSLDGRAYQDLYGVSLATGERKLLAKQVRWAFGTSPDGSKVLFYNDGHFMVADASSGEVTNITRALPVSFVDTEDDHNVVKPPVGPEGWTADSKSVLLSDRFDIWQVPVGGGQAVNVTVNGRRDRIEYSRLSVDPDEKGADLSVPQYYGMLGEQTKKGGLARGLPGKPGVEVLAWDDAAYGRLLKAKRADTLAYTRETDKTFPDFHIADAQLKGERRLTDGQAQIAPYTWTSGSRLIEFASAAPGTKGKKMQAALYLPANYEPGKRYPTIVYIYERLTDGLNRFTQLDTAHRVNKSYYTSNGYAVLTPDIGYTLNDPGMSAVWHVLPALKAAIATGVVDEARVGIQGHSWGGYQTAFLVTQTKAFKAAIAGAPLTDMISMYSLVYKNSGGGNGAIFESSQGRFLGGYWDNWEAYVRNSPIAHAKNVTTPLVILHNDKDGAVDFTQGIEYYNTLRRLKKPVVLLEYVGENHGLAKPENKYDYFVRMREFFDYQLKGAPAPTWWTDGVPRLEMDQHLKDRRAPKPAPASKPKPVPTTTTASSVSSSPSSATPAVAAAAAAGAAKP